MDHSPQSDERQRLSAATAYLESSAQARVLTAFELAQHLHGDQARSSGEPYYTHPLAVALSLAQWRMDADTLAAGLLHDVLEDTTLSAEELEQYMGQRVRFLVESVTKLARVEFDNQFAAEAENFRRMLVALAADVRVILIKLADRLHNMQTLFALRPERQIAIARETLEIYAPIAHRMGLGQLCHQLEDLAFRYLHPARYRVLSQAIKLSRKTRDSYIEETRKDIALALASANIRAETQGREKSLYSIYRKMQRKHLSLHEVLDVLAFRVIVDSEEQCYQALRVIHKLYKPLPGSFDDYIALIKPNGYQSLHTSLQGLHNRAIEVQIRTHAMHRVAEQGVAAHWLYKTGDDHSPLSVLQAATHDWVQGLLELHAKSDHPEEFLEHMRTDLYADQVYAFTPKGQIHTLPRGATALDFAYAVHTKVGNHMNGCRINGQLQPLSYRLQHGDRVEILTQAEQRPHPGWLTYVITARARSSIRHALNTMATADAITMGEHLLAKALSSLRPDQPVLSDDEKQQLVAFSEAADYNELLAELGSGRALPSLVARTALGLAAGQYSQGALPIRGDEGAALHYASCCQPVPGDAITGWMGPQRIEVHRQLCPVIGRQQIDKMLLLDWAEEVEGSFESTLEVNLTNTRGILARISQVISETEADIEGVEIHIAHGTDHATNRFRIRVSHLQQVEELIRRLEQTEGVRKVLRSSAQKH